MKQFVKRKIHYPGRPDTAEIRRLIDQDRHPGWPYCPPDEGDLLYLLAQQAPGTRMLEVGCATGSTSVYMLAGMLDGKLTSIDFAHGDHGRSGEKLIERGGFAGRHTLVERNSIETLPEMFLDGDRFGLIFLDGWKSFDHLWVDTFYCAKMLEVGGYIVFDDARMPAVRKAVSLLKSHYGFEPVDGYAMVGGRALRLWHALISRSAHPHYLALRKPRDISETPAGRIFDFWAPF